MTLARKAITLKIKDLLGGALPNAGQKTRAGWQALPGTSLMERV